MRPILFEIGPIPVYGYGFMMLLGFFFAMQLAAYRFRTKGLNPDIVYDFGMLAMISGVLGARIFYLIQYNSAFQWNLFHIWDGGLSIIGGVIGVIAFAACYKQTRVCNYLAITLLLSVIGKYHGKIATAPGTINILDVVFVLIALTFSFQNKSRIKEDWGAASGKKKAYSMVMAAILFIFSARAVYCYIYSVNYSWGIFMIWKGGLVFYGGFILAVVTLLTFFYYKNLPILKTCDTLAPSVALGLGFARLGCLFNGCCFGGVCPPNSAMGLHFPPYSLVGQNLNLKGISLSYLENSYGAGSFGPAFINTISQRLPEGLYQFVFDAVYPTQLLSSLNGMVLCFVLLLFYRHRKNDGEVILLFGILYSIFRFVVEILRDDTDPVLGTGLTVSQNISCVLFTLCLGAFLYLRVRAAMSKKHELKT